MKMRQIFQLTGTQYEHVYRTYSVANPIGTKMSVPVFQVFLDQVLKINENSQR